MRIPDSSIKTGTPSNSTPDSAPDSAPKSAPNSATLSLLRWENDTVIGSATLSKKGEFIFSGKESLVPGEYMIKWNNRPVEFFVSDSNSYTNEKLILRGEEIVQLKGSVENAHFTRFQNLVNYQWRSLANSKEFMRKIDSIGNSVEGDKELLNSLLNLYIGQYLSKNKTPERYHSNNTYAKYLKDYRIQNTRFGKEVVKYFFKEFDPIWSSSDDVINTTRDFLGENGINPHMATLLLIEGFNFYKESEVMGEEEKACKLYEAFFKSKEFKAPDEAMFQMRTFYLLNKSSLLGMQAPELLMQDTLGAAQSLLEIAKQGRYTILYFYTDDCLTCKIETPKLVNFVNDYTASPINVYAVYTQDNRERWINYIDEKLQTANPLVRWINVWDPKIDTGFHMLYNVVSTPQMFLIDKNGRIIGRRLNAKALEELITQTDRYFKR